ncbi:MAG: phage minor head protein [Cetobacterium sp.]
MNHHKKKFLANRERVLLGRLIKENEKIIANIFIEFANEIKSKVNKEELIKIDFTNFTRNMRRAFNNIFIKNSEKVVEWKKTLFGWKLENSVIERVRNKSLNDYNKNESGKNVTYVTDSVKKKVGKIITEKQAKGLNYKDIAKEIESEIVSMSKSRAKRIALTETCNAVNIVGHNTATSAQMGTKTWMHVGGGFDDREAHERLDGKEIKINEYFDVNGHKALYPHDPNLPVGEIVNCHCICIYD